MTAAKTLLLDQGYQPLKLISWQRAITLLTLGKVEIVEEYDQEIRSTSIVLKMPAVARLLNAFKRPKKPVKFSRVSIYARDKYSCQYCGDKKPMSELTYDHVIPRAQGGKTTWDNITTACYDCNTKKANRTPAQAGMKLRNEPYQPTWIPAVTIRLSQKDLPQAWMDYLYWHSELES